MVVYTCGRGRRVLKQNNIIFRPVWPETLSYCSFAVKRLHDFGASYKGQHLIRVAYSFSGSVHFHYCGAHSSLQTDMVLEKELRAQSPSPSGALPPAKPHLLQLGPPPNSTTSYGPSLHTLESMVAIPISNHHK